MPFATAWLRISNGKVTILLDFVSDFILAVSLPVLAHSFRPRYSSYESKFEVQPLGSFSRTFRLLLLGRITLIII